MLRDTFAMLAGRGILVVKCIFEKSSEILWAENKSAAAWSWALK